jgi:hypothetical protein
MDINTVSNDKIFYNITGTWTKSKYEGSLMIRPVFGKSIVTALAKNPSFINNIDIKLYPNPVNDILNFRIDNEITEQLYIYVIDTRGSIIYKNVIEDKQGSIDLSGYIQGVYFLKIINRTGKFNKTYKIIKQ